MQDIRIPTIEECYKLMKLHDMLPHIIEHSEQVARVALAIMANLIDNTSINREVVITSCLLHDITKTRSLRTMEHHEISGGRLLAELGFPVIGAVIEEHVKLKNFRASGNLLNKEIVFYADKRVMHDRIVTLKERAADIIVRYGTSKERIRLITSNFEQACQLEVKIRRFMAFDIQEVFEEIDGSSRPYHWMKNPDIVNA